MSYVPGYKARLLVGDFNLAAYATAASAPWSQEMLDSTVLTSGGVKQFIAGQDTSTYQVSGLYDVAAFSDVTSWKSSTAQAVTHAPSGLALGSELWMVNGLLSSFELGSAANGIATFDLGCQTDGSTDIGVSLHDLTAATADTDGATHDGSAASADGGVGHLHVTEFSGFTSAVIKVQHSTNGSVWADLLTFTTATGVTGERSLVAAGTTVNRYLRYSIDVTVTGSVTFAVGFARR